MLNTYQDSTKKIVQYLIIFASFSIVLPTAWMSVASGLILIFWIISGNYNEKFKRILDNPSAMSALIVFGWSSNFAFNFLFKMVVDHSYGFRFA